MAALRRFGAPLFDLSVNDLVRPGTVYQFGVPPRRIDVLTAIDGVDFDGAWDRRVTTELGGVLGDLDVVAGGGLLFGVRTGRTRAARR